jgi:hypothetical protein
MPKNKPPRGRVAPEHLPKLWEALGGDFGSVENDTITKMISKIADRYWASWDQPTVAQAVRILRQIRDNRTMECKSWKQLESIRPQIAAAAMFRRPEIEPSHVLLVKDIILKEHRDDLDDRLHERDLDIEFLIKNPQELGRMLNRSDKDYRKRAESALVIEPFLDLLDQYRVVPSRTHPLTKMVAALYRVIGIANPPSPVGIRQIVNARKRKTKR